MKDKGYKGLEGFLIFIVYGGIDNIRWGYRVRIVFMGINKDFVYVV